MELTFDLFVEHLLEIFAEIKRILKKTGTFFLNLGDCYSFHSIEEGNVGGIEGKIAKNNKAYKKAIKAIGTRFDKKNYGGLRQKRLNTMSQGRGRGLPVPDKCLLMMPEKIAIKMIDTQGWILRNYIVWAKQILKFNKDASKYTIRSVVPTSVHDRLNESYEFLYFFTKNNKKILWRNKNTKEWVNKKPLGTLKVRN